MKWQGRQGSDNVEDRRGMSTGKMAVGGGIGTIVIVLIVLLLGGDPSAVVDTMQSTPVESGTTTFTAEEEEMAQFVSVVLKDTETIWGKIFQAVRFHIQAADTCSFQRPGAVSLRLCKCCKRTILLPG